MWRDFPLVAAVVGVCASIASFVALMEIRAPGWGVVAVEHASGVLLGLAIALALAIKRRPTVGAWQFQIAAATVAVAFVIVAFVKTYSRSPVASSIGGGLDWASEAQTVGLAALAFGLIGLRVASRVSWIAFLAAVSVAVGLAGYAITLKFDFRAFVWYLAAGTTASLAGSAAARMRRR